MNITDIAQLRLYNQQLATTDLKKAKDIVSWMGVMQAQDYNMSKWAVGIRLPASTENIVETAIHKGEIIRTHLLRPTWHLVSPNDIYWMLALSAPKLKASLRSRLKELELTEAVRKKSNKTIENALSKKGHLTRSELLTELKNANIPVDNYRSSHLLFWAEMEELICSGSLKEKEPTYALLSEWVPKKKTYTRDEAIAQLALRYFNSHGPATLPDFIWWSGLNITEARQGLESIQHKLHKEKTGDHIYWMPGSLVTPVKKQSAVYLLPAFDEYVISYKDRSAILALAHQNKAISNNGLFSPVVIVNGQVAGIWKRTIKKDKVLVELELFKSLPATSNTQIKKALAAYSHFLGKPVEMKQAVVQ